MDHKPGIRQTPINQLTLHPKNPRDGDIGAISESIQENGWFGTVVAQVSTGHVLAGNHRVQAAQHLGMDKVPVHWVDVDDETGLRILLADNRTSDLATYKDEELAEVLERLAKKGKLGGSGYDGDDLDALLFDIERNKGNLGNLLDDVEESIEQRRQALLTAGIRSIIIPFPLDDYNEVVARLAQLRTKLGVDSNAAVILQLTAE